MKAWRAILGLAILVPTMGRAWDSAGHMLVNQIAWEVMTPEVRARAQELVKPLDTRFNENQPYHFVTAGAWMDDMRGVGRDYLWSKLHYIDIPWVENGGPAELPPEPHVISAIADSTKVLGDPQAAPAQRIEAFAMLIHLVGDVHQPLHTTDRNYDRGGNTYLISGVPFSDLRAKQSPSLHTFWDKAFRFDGMDDQIVEVLSGPPVYERPKAPGDGVIAEEAKKITADFPRAELPELAMLGDATAWAKESHAIACQYAYPPGDPPENTDVRALTPEFVHESRAIARRRIALAGYRLGDLLNRLLAAPAQGQ